MPGLPSRRMNWRYAGGTAAPDRSSTMTRVVARPPPCDRFASSPSTLYPFASEFGRPGRACCVRAWWLAANTEEDENKSRPRLRLANVILAPHTALCLTELVEETLMMPCEEQGRGQLKRWLISAYP